jgi:uncharacterized membrane protein YkoI
MNSKYRLMLVALAAGALMVAGTTGAKEDSKEAAETPIKGTIAVGKAKFAELPSMAKLGLVEAINAAVARVPGKAFKAEIKAEDGFLVYEVEVVAADKKWTEVLVDAGSGAILAVSQDEEDAKEGDEKGCKDGEDADNEEDGESDEE